MPKNLSNNAWTLQDGTVVTINDVNTYVHTLANSETFIPRSREAAELRYPKGPVSPKPSGAGAIFDCSGAASRRGEVSGMIESFPSIKNATEWLTSQLQHYKNWLLVFSQQHMLPDGGLQPMPESGVSAEGWIANQILHGVFLLVLHKLLHKNLISFGENIMYIGITINGQWELVRIKLHEPYAESSYGPCSGLSFLQNIK